MRTAAVLLWAAWSGACGAPAHAPDPDATLVVFGQDAASLAWERVQDVLVATWVHPFPTGDMAIEETFRFDADGALMAWSRVRPDGSGRWLEVAEDGKAWWRLTEGGLDRQGTWVLPERPRTWAGPLPPAGPWTWWDGQQIVPVQVGIDGPTHRVHAPDGRTWALTGSPESRAARFPDGSLLDPTPRPVAPYDPAEALSRPGPWHPAPRRARQLDAVAGIIPIHQRRPTAPELPRVPTQGPAPDAPMWALPLTPDPVDLGVVSSPDRLVTVSRAQHAVHALASAQGHRGVPEPLRTLAEGGDCDDLSTLLVAGLAHEGVPARVVRGWLLSDRGRWVRHAWVRIPMASPTPWLEVDPALGQLPADAARLADDVLPPGFAPDALEHVVVR